LAQAGEVRHVLEQLGVVDVWDEAHVAGGSLEGFGGVCTIAVVDLLGWCRWREESADEDAEALEVLQEDGDAPWALLESFSDGLGPLAASLEERSLLGAWVVLPFVLCVDLDERLEAHRHVQVRRDLLFITHLLVLVFLRFRPINQGHEDDLVLDHAVVLQYEGSVHPDLALQLLRRQDGRERDAELAQVLVLDVMLAARLGNLLNLLLLIEEGEVDQHLALLELLLREVGLVLRFQSELQDLVPLGALPIRDTRLQDLLVVWVLWVHQPDLDQWLHLLQGE